MDIVCSCGTPLSDKQIQLDFIRKIIKTKKEDPSFEGDSNTIKELLDKQAKFINEACDTNNKICCKKIMITYINMIELIK